MAAVTLGSVAFEAVPNYDAVGKWVEGGTVNAPNYLKTFPDAPGVDGTGVKRFGFRSQSAQIRVIYVGAAEADPGSAAQADMLTLANAAFTAEIDGVSYPFCELDPNGSGVSLATRACGDNFYREATFSIFQTRKE